MASGERRRSSRDPSSGPAAGRWPQARSVAPRPLGGRNQMLRISEAGNGSDREIKKVAAGHLVSSPRADWRKQRPDWEGGPAATGREGSAQLPVPSGRRAVVSEGPALWEGMWHVDLRLHCACLRSRRTHRRARGEARSGRAESEHGLDGWPDMVFTAPALAGRVRSRQQQTAADREAAWQLPSSPLPSHCVTRRWGRSLDTGHCMAALPRQVHLSHRQGPSAVHSCTPPLPASELP